MILYLGFAIFILGVLCGLFLAFVDRESYGGLFYLSGFVFIVAYAVSAGSGLSESASVILGGLAAEVVFLLYYSVAEIFERRRYRRWEEKLKKNEPPSSDDYHRRGD